MSLQSTRIPVKCEIGGLKYAADINFNTLPEIKNSGTTTKEGCPSGLRCNLGKVV